MVIGAVLAMGLVLVPDASTPRANANPLFEWRNANVSQVEVGGEHTCAIQDGVLFCWGAGTQGQLGYLPPPRPPVLPSPTDQLRPVRVSPNTNIGFHNLNVTAVSASGAVTCAIEEGYLYCWGANGVAQLGIGTYTSREATPRKVSSVSGGFQNNGTVTAVSVDGTGVCAIEAGVVYCWGANGLGNVGNGQTTNNVNPHPSTPRMVVDHDGFVNSSANGGVTAVTRGLTTCAIKNGELFCWGAGSSGQMGNGSFDNANSRPRKVGSGADGFANNNVVAVSSTGVGVCAVRSENNNTQSVMYCWGNGGFGNFGIGIQTNAQSTPRKVLSSGGMSNTAVTSHHVGNASCAVDAGTVYCFGINWNGQVGDGTTTQRLSPVRVSSAGGMANVAVTMVSTKTDHACALEGGSVYCWGRAAKGRLGNEETTPDRLFPVAAASTPGAPTLTGATVGTDNGIGTATVTISAGPGGVPTTFTVTASAGTSVSTCTVTVSATSTTCSTWQPPLADGTTYTFTATASSDKGTSPVSNALTRTTGAAAIPNAPDLVAGVGSVTVSVNPTTSGGTPTGYIATSSPDGGTCTIVSPATSCVISPLTNGSTSAVTLQAFNDAGTSGASHPSTVTVGATATPGPPTLEVASQSLTVTVSATTSGGTPTHYTVHLVPGGQTCTVTPPATNCTFTGLTNGTLYTVTTTATNGGGTSAPSTPVTQLVDIVPIPVTPTVEVGSNGVTISVASLPSPGGGTPQQYVVTLSAASGTVSAQTVTLTPPATTSALFFPGLTVGEPYSVTVSAINDIGSASASTDFLYDLPGVPQIGVLTITSTSATVTVSAGTPGGPPSSYIVYVGPGSCTIDAPATSCTVEGLTTDVNGTTTYTATASATNGLGTTTNSAGVEALFAAPGAPDGPPTVEVGNGSVTVTVAPATTGGRPSHYTVYLTPGDRTCVVTPPATSCTFSGLTNGTVYTVTTAAVNDFGTSPSSPATGPFLVDATPATPNPPTVVVGDGGVTVSVTSPTGGGSVVTYSATVMPGGYTCDITMPADPASCFFPLTTTSAYTVTVMAMNQLPTASAATSPVEFLFEGPPAPVVQTVAIGFGQVTVSVAPGTGTGGAPNFFTVYVGSSSCVVVPPATSCTVTGLAGGQQYAVTASATNGITTTPSSNSLEARLIAPLSPPAPIAVVDSATSATVYVNPATGGEVPSKYIVTRVPGDVTCEVTPPEEVSCAFTGLTAGEEYSFSVVAQNAYGPSAPGLATNVLLQAPPTPLAPTVVPGTARATVTIQPGTGGGPASEYLVFVEPGTFTCDGGDPIRPPDISCVVSGLTNDVEYTFTVIASNGVGNTSVSAATTATPRLPPPPPPGGGTTTTTTTTVPPTTTTRPPSTTVPPTTTRPPSTTVPPPVTDPETGVLPDLTPGESSVIENGTVVPVRVAAVSPSQVAVIGNGFELLLQAECASACAIVTTDEGRPVIQLEESGGVRVTGTGFRPGSLVVVWVFSEPRALGTLTVSADSTFAGLLPLGDLETGQHTLQVSGVSATGALRTANLGVLVSDAGVPTPGPGRLPATGNGSGGPLSTLALVLLVSGGVSLVSRRPLRSARRS